MGMDGGEGGFQRQGTGGLLEETYGLLCGGGGSGGWGGGAARGSGEGKGRCLSDKS